MDKEPIRLLKTYRNGDTRYYSLKDDYYQIKGLKANELKKAGIKYQSHQFYYEWQFIINVSELPKVAKLLSEKDINYYKEYNKRILELMNIEV